ncbi:MAG: fused MFS/spermidine synthase [Planctomycetes bacterium]|nr:fused MFS/spermidine synthase [Planctomycetota bacterium]
MNRPGQHPDPVAAPGPPPLRWADLRTRVLVFTGGAGLMALEIAGSRVIAPHFGSSLFLWAGLIAVFLLALSAGYFAGGWIGDRHPHPASLNYAVGGAGLLSLFVPHLSIAVCNAVEPLGPRWGPIAAAALLFGGPSLLLGTVSPIAVRLHTREVRASGSSAGSLYALSTVGSLAGTFLATFVLVPVAGTPVLLMSLGAVLAALPLLTLPKTALLAFYAVPAGVLGAVLFTTPLPDAQISAPGTDAYGHVLHEVETPYHRIFVVESKEEGKPVRYLQFDHYVESGISMEPPYPSVTRYTDMFHLAALFQPRPKAVLFVGGGGMIGPRVFEEVYPSLETIDVVEIDPEVVRVARDYFHFQPGPKTRIRIGDGRVVASSDAGTLDVFVLDAFSGGGRIPFHLLTREFFEAVENRLSPDGVLLVNLIGALDGPKSKVFRAAFRTLAEVFPQAYAFPRTGHFAESEGEAETLLGWIRTYAEDPRALPEESRAQVERVRNIILVGTRAEGRVPADELRRRAKALEGSGAVPERYRLPMHATALAPSVRTGDVPTLTDDYAPVEQWKTW